MAAIDEAQEKSEEKDTSVEAVKVISSEEKKMKLEDLKVSELKSELEKRDLDKNGVKSVLVERLKAALIEQGENPEEYDFNASKSANNNLSVNDNKGDSETNGTVESNDDFNSNEEKQEVALQLSLDEEEAQLNEENLIESSKQSCTENSKTEEELSGVTTITNLTVIEQSTPVKTGKSSEQVKDKTTVSGKCSDVNLKVSPKVLKVTKSDKLKSPSVLAKSVWISGLPNDTRPADLKHLFSNQGRVLSVKILKSAKRTPGKCYGFVTMSTSKEAAKAIQSLHRTEFNGHVISVEKKQSEPSTLLVKKSDSKVSVLTKKIIPKKGTLSPKKLVSKGKKSTASELKAPKNEVKEKKVIEESVGKKHEKAKVSEKPKDKKERDHKEKDNKKPEQRSSSKSHSYSYNDRSRYSDPRPPFSRRPFSNRVGSTFRPRSSYFLQRMREERFQRERLREKREAERRRIDELTRHRYIERKQREEAYRLEREKERLRIERELLERERAEIIKLEREKHRLEREKLERERDELRRQAELRSAKRPFSRIDRDADLLWGDRKKAASRYDVRPEAPSRSRFEFSPRERPSSSFTSRERSSLGREVDRHSDRYNSQKHLDILPRSSFLDRDTRREITIRRDERQIFNRSDYRDRDNRRSLNSREPERNSSRREVSRNDWKQDRRVHERVPSSSGQRRLNYF